MHRHEAAHDEHELPRPTGHRRSATPKLTVVLPQSTRGLLRVSHVRARTYRTAQHIHALSISLALFRLRFRIDELCVVALNVVVFLVVLIEVHLAS